MKTGTTIKLGRHTCPWWLLFTFDNPIRSLVHNPKEILSPYIHPGDTVLDVGCGMGYFTLELAELVGHEGKIIAADLQEKMLAGLRKRSERVGLRDRIELCRSTPDQIGLNQAIDFALAFWMVHEVRDQQGFLDQIYSTLKPEGKLLLVEPILHVNGKAFGQTAMLANEIGFRVIAQPQVKSSRSLLLGK